MIRPVTCLCVLLAAGSGLYLYQVKHRTLMLDAQIADVLKQADAARARTAVLHAEYAALSQSQRVGDLSARFLSLRPTAPGQWAQLASLDTHLPPVEHFPSPGELAAAAPGPGARPAAVTDADADADATTVDAAPAAPPADAVLAAVAPAGHAPAPEHVTAPEHHAVPPVTRYAAVARAPVPAVAVPRPAVVAATAPRPVASPARPRVETTYAAYSPPPPRGALRGSMLGQSAALTMAAPVPVAN